MRRTATSGSVVLVALSCVAVLGIATVAFLAVSNPAMQLSNRAYLKVVSKNLAEAGLERALRSFNAGDFVSGGAWTINLSTATANLTFSIPTSRYSTTIDRTTGKTAPRNITTAVKVRVDRYLDRATRKGVIWSPFVTYMPNDYVWHHGVWYLCKAPPPARQSPSSTNSSFPGTAYWTAAPDNWSPYANYHNENVVLYEGRAYTCSTPNINKAPSGGAGWSAGVIVAAWNATTVYSVGTIVFHGGIPYRCIAPHTPPQSPPNPAYWLSAPVIYSEGTASLQVGSFVGAVSMPITTQVRAMLAPAPLFPNALGATRDVNFSGTSFVDSYNSVLGNYTTTRSAQAVVAGGDTAASNAVALSSTRVFGFVAATSNNTAPHAPRMSKSNSGFVTGNLSATTNAAHDLTRITRSPHVPKFDVMSFSPLPSGFESIGYAYGDTTSTLREGATPLGAASVIKKYYIANTKEGGSIRSGLYLNDATDVITIDYPVVLYVGGPLQIDYGSIIINSGGSLEMYFTEELKVEDRGISSGGIDNRTGDPKKCLLVGTIDNSSQWINYFKSRRPFFGVIYMPDAYPRTATNVVMYGAISAEFIGVPESGNYFRYDTSLRTAGAIGTYIDAPYITSEVRELIDATERVTLP